MNLLQQDFYVAGWYVQPRLNQITGPSGRLVQMTPRVMRLLVHLAERAGEVWEREALLDSVWEQTVVSEDSLTQAVSELRKLFNDDPRDPQYIRTVRNVGYQLVAPVRLADPALIAGDGLTLGDGVSAAEPTWMPTARRTHTPVWGWALGTALVVAFVIMGWQWLRGPLAAPLVQTIPLTSYPGHEVEPALSPDGELIAFVWSEGEQTPAIYIKRVDTETPIRLTQPPARFVDGSPVWAPDGRALAFMRADVWGGNCGIYMKPMPSGDEHNVAACQVKTPQALAWSPDGAWLAFADQEATDQPFRIYRVSTETFVVETLSDPPPGIYGDLFPAYAPDGERLAFVRGVMEGTLARVASSVIGDVYIMPAEGGGAQALTNDNQQFPGLAWHPDSEQVIFASDRQGGTFRLWQAALGTRQLRGLLNTQGVALHPTVAAQGDRLVFQLTNRDTNIWRLRLDGEQPATPEPFLVSTRLEATPDYSPDGSQVAFASNRTGHHEIWVADAEGQRPRQLTTFGGAHTTWPRWSPDGTQIAFESWQAGNADVYVMQAQGGVPRRITTHSAHDMVPVWSPDGEWLYFGSSRSGTWQLWRIPAAGGEAEQVTHDGGFLAQFPPSASDSLLYVARLDANGPWQLPRAGGTAARLSDTWELWTNDWGYWRTHTDGIYFTSLYRGDQALLRYTFATEAIDTLAVVPSFTDWNLPGLAISPDGQWLLFTQLDQSAGDLMMIEGL